MCVHCTVHCLIHSTQHQHCFILFLNTRLPTMIWHGIIWISLLILTRCSAYTNLQHENMFRILSSPDIPVEYSSSSEHEASSVQECTNLCNRHGDCQAAVLNLNSSTCSLHIDAVVNATSTLTLNNLIYLESVCASNANNRPSYCPEVPPVPGVLKDCQEFYENGFSTDGVYTINIPDSGLDPFDVWCDFFDGHGWTTIQKRLDGSVDFYVYWSDYKNGFGNIDGEHWMGNDRIYALTQTNQKLNIYLEAADGTYRNGYWTQFYIADESDKYRLTVTADGYTGDAEEQLTAQHNGMRFSAKDNDNDNYSGNCAVSYTGAWWYNGCHSVNINGIYTSNGVSHSGAAGVNWCCSWKSHSDSLLKTIMRVTRD